VFAGREYYSGIFFLACSIIGLATSLASQNSGTDPAKKVPRQFLAILWTQGNSSAGTRAVAAVLGNTLLLLPWRVVQFDKSSSTRATSSASPATHGSLLQAAIAIGIGLGSLAAGYLSAEKLSMADSPGRRGHHAFGFLLFASGLSFNAVLAFLAALGFSGGFFIVPISALIQHRPEEQHRGGVLAAANLYSFIGILGGSGAFYLLKHYLRLGPAGIFSGPLDFDARRHLPIFCGYCPIPAAPAAVDCGPHDLPPRPEGPGKHPRPWRSAPNPESFLLD